MKKKIFFSLACIISIVGLGITISLHTNATPSYESTLAKWGQYLSSSQYDMKTYVTGENIRLVSSDVKQAQEFFLLNGMSDDAALQEAILYMAEREVLYLQAIEAGYEVSDAEVDAYLQELKALIAVADNKEDAQIIISQFGSEDEYWDYQFKVYKKNLPIQRFVADLENDFMKSNQQLDVAERESAWLEYFESYKQELVEAENLSIVQ